MSYAVPVTAVFEAGPPDGTATAIGTAEVRNRVHPTPAAAPASVTTARLMIQRGRRDRRRGVGSGGDDGTAAVTPTSASSNAPSEEKRRAGSVEIACSAICTKSS